jgi:hypothetical protein
MRGSLSRLRSTIGFLAAILLLAAAYRGGNAVSQTQPPSQLPTLPGQNGGRPPFGQESDTNPDPNLRRAQQEAAAKRNVERQKKLVAESNRILQLAQELNADVDPAGKDPLPSTIAKKAEEVEKLARSVKDLMRSE